MDEGRDPRYSRWGIAAVAMVVAVIVAAVSAAGGTSAAGPTDWPAYLGDPSHDSYTSDAQITKAGAAHLGLAWKWTPTAGTLSGQPAGGIFASPTVFNHRIYIGANTGDFYALDDATGKAVWKRFLGFQPNLGCAAMGFVSTATVLDPTGTGASPLVYVAAPDGNLYALDGNTGSTVWQSVVVKPSTTVNDAFNWSSPTIVGDRIYVGFSSNCDVPFIRGGLAEFDRLTGTRLATFYSVPAGSVGGGVWTSAAVGSTGVYIATGSGGSHTANDSYSVVRLDPVSLARLGGWIVPLAQQAAGDADFGSSPIVFHATIGGADTELVGACNKDGVFYAFANGDMSAPLWSYQVGVATSDGGSSCLAGGIWDGSRLFLAGNETTIGGTDFQGAIRQIDPATGAPIWERGLSGNVLGAPSENGAGVIAAATFDYIPSGLTNQAYLIDSDSGAVLSTINNANAKEFGQPVFADQYLFLTTTNSIFAYTPDAQAPSVPTGLTATANGTGEIDLAWSASTDNVGVKGYHVFRDGGATPFATTTGTSFADTGLAPGTTHSYAVSAFDAAGNESAPTSSVSATTALTGSTSLTLKPVADAYVSAGAPTTNYGTLSSLRVDGSPIVRSYLRFNISGLGGSVTKATLRVHAGSSQGTGYDVFGVSNTTWSETAINYNNAPASAAAKTGSSGAVTSGTWTSVNVTPLITGNGTISLSLSTSNSTALSLASRESGANAPQLVIETSGGGGGGGNQPPVANPLSLNATTAVSTPWTPSVSDPNGDPLMCQIVTPATSGTASVNSDCSGGTYTSNAAFAGSDSFAYKAMDPGGLSSAPAAVNVTVSSGGGGGGGGGGSIAFVQQKAGSGSAATLPVTLTAPSTSGHTLVTVVALAAGSSASVKSVTDSAGGSGWTAGPIGFLTGTNSRVEIWYRLGAPPVTSVTVTLSAAKSAAVNVSEWSGVATASALDASKGASTASSTSAATPLLATTNATDLVIGAINYPATATSTLTSGSFTSLNDFGTSGVHGRAAYLLTSAKGSYQAAWTLSVASGANGSAILALKAS